MRAAGVAARLVVVLLGAWVGVAGALVHRQQLDGPLLDWPWGLALGLAVTAAVAAGCDRLVRVGAAWFGLGWTVVLLVPQLDPSRGYLVADDALGWSWTLGGLGVLTAVTVLAPRLSR